MSKWCIASAIACSELCNLVTNIIELVFNLLRSSSFYQLLERKNCTFGCDIDMGAMCLTGTFCVPIVELISSNLTFSGARAGSQCRFQVRQDSGPDQQKPQHSRPARLRKSSSIIGSDWIGSDRIGSDRIGSDRIGIRLSKIQLFFFFFFPLSACPSPSDQCCSGIPAFV